MEWNRTSRGERRTQSRQRGGQKSMQRPLRSQSPKRVGSGPVGPPTSFGAPAFGAGAAPLLGAAGGPAAGAGGAGAAGAGDWVSVLMRRR